MSRSTFFVVYFNINVIKERFFGVQIASAAGRSRHKSGCSAASRLEIFTGVAIAVILRLSIWGARLRWAACADNEPTATEGGDPSGTYKRWSIAS